MRDGNAWAQGQPLPEAIGLTASSWSPRGKATLACTCRHVVGAVLPRTGTPTDRACAIVDYRRAPGQGHRQRA